jgi:hypothetical protein
VAGVALVAANLPMIYINFSHGVYMLTPTRSDMQLFRSNGLDSLGLASYNGISEQLMGAQKTSYTEALRKDIERDPSRLLELTLRRIGLIWQSEEHSDADQVDYENYSLKVSPTTQLLSLNGTLTFRTLLVMALTGGLLGLLARRRESLLLMAGAAVWVLTMVPFYSLARFRIGMVVFLLPLAALALWESVNLLWGVFKTDSQPSQSDESKSANLASHHRYAVSRLWSLVIIAAVFSLNVFVLWAADWLTEYMPRPQLVSESEFPSNFVPVGGVFGDEIQLLGYAHYESDYTSEGYLTLELFWRSVTQPTEDVFVSLRLVDTETRQIVQQENIRLGENTAPAWPPTQWKVEDTLFEKYLLHLPTVEKPASYALFVGLFSMAQDSGLLLTQATDESLDQHVRVTAVSAFPEAQQASRLPPLATWQEKIGLVKTECTLSENLVLDLTWQIEQRIEHDLRFFVHVWDGDTLLTQQDARLQPPADALPVNAQITNHLALQDIESSALSVRVGFYRFQDGQRLPVSFLAENFTEIDSAVTLPCDS